MLHHDGSSTKIRATLGMPLRYISEDGVHNITSGQVITELASIVKELVENSLDAQSTSITVNFKRFGMDGIEVIDNGNGIEEEDFDSLCMKNYTSKLDKFENLVKVQTLGFRGEALNSICNVAQMIISTATHGSAPKGYELIYDKRGNLQSKKLINQKKGTITRVNEIFKDLPVRKINLEKQHRREFNHAINVLTSYLIIRKNVRFIVSNTDATGRKKILLKTGCNKLIKDNIINVYGSTGLQGLIDFYAKIDLDVSISIDINGLLSSASIGDGRLTKDRQFIYINKRPVTFKRLSKLINSTYKRYNYLQNPVFFLDLGIPEDIIDINVTPDKGIVLLSSKYENILIDQLETKFEEFWDNSGSYSIPLNSSYQEKVESRNQSLSQPTLESFAFISGVENEGTNDKAHEVSMVERASIRNSRVVNRIGVKHEGEASESNYNTQDVEEISIIEENAQGSSYLLEEDTQISFRGVSTKKDSERTNYDLLLEENLVLSQLEESITAQEVGHSPVSCCSHNDHMQDKSQLESSLFVSEDHVQGIDHDEQESKEPKLISNHHEEIEISRPVPTEKVVEDSPIVKVENSVTKHKIFISDEDLKLFRLKETCEISANCEKTLTPSDITDREGSERYLSLSIHKKDFKNMKVIGQFNKGFIIVYKEDTGDLLIVDQHASDEKFNFENLLANTTFKDQPLVVPQRVEVSSMEKLIILANLNTFEKNGFRFKTINEKNDGDDSIHEELYLTSLPYSKNTIFTTNDMNELIQLVQERGVSISSIPRPSKVRSMFAMRACRSSIMIGQALNRTKMETIVQNLSVLDKPWNCPHGRPTMRHILNINKWKPFDEDYL